MARICLIEDDPIMGESLVERLKLEGYEVTLYTSGKAALEGLTEQPCDALVSDIRLPDINGADLYRQLAQRLKPIPPAIFITAYGTIDQAVELLRLGAADYLTKPLDIPRFLDKLAAVCRQPASPRDGEPQLGLSRAMREIESTLSRVARYPEASVLLQGESGVGKEIAARLLHAQQCPDAPFEAVNCAALPEALAASELFGHERGAFTGAIKSHSGAFERAGDGILFLDEIGDMPRELQAQLLRALQERTFSPVGSETASPFRARVVCATNQDLHARVQSGEFREDLYYRINVIQITIPPLSERPEDIVWLAERFLQQAGERHNEPPRQLSDAALAVLAARNWPGNVRELKHHIERLCILSDAPVIDVEHLGLDNEPHPNKTTNSLRQGREQEEKRRIATALTESDGCIGDAARLLGISRKSLWQKRKKYDL
ncbi:sigma-54 dependent transcriptional regulator [Thiohalophilus sp.]|uniref:sigma-54-dependent transcriptional regulator n=1 Tax=Thiohalophilus sp. TaxID=3028392 RepID=UPI002ACECA79|nr:sigma-54 dependent transcriptional regulator [Thiohalophilus sp.]MDZ7663342.1 sigma-54 dependent transcriptional regulator [Thiohalophilus sp.]